MSLTGSERNPIFITIEHESGLTTAPNGFTEGEGTEADSTFINNHFIFDLGNSDDALFSFLTLTNNTDTWPNGEGAVVGLYGEFSPGRIVLTGLDNDYHGGNNVSSDEQRNHYNLLKNEIVWGSSPDLCVKAEEAPRLRLGCLGDLLFLEE